MPIKKDITGKRFGKLVAVKVVGSHHFYGRIWECKCDCGKIALAPLRSLTYGNKRSCGCLKFVGGGRKEFHGLRGTKEYSTWASMKNRCRFDVWYRKRKIRVCKRWSKSFLDFLKDVGKAPSKDHSIERVNNDLGYEPGNVIWATMEVQQNNKTNSRLLTFNGKTQTVSRWAKELGMNDWVLHSRLKYGWSVERMLSTPVKVKKPIICR